MKVWLGIDEAHNFCPSCKSALAKEVLTQCGISVEHLITSRHDYQAISQDYLGEGLAVQIKRLSGPREELIIDDEQELVVHVQVRPRQTQHSGGSAQG